MKLIGIVGTGGFGREVMPLLAAMFNNHNDANVKLVFVDENKTKDKVNDYPVYTMEAFLNDSSVEKYFNIAIANHEQRKRIAEMLLSEGLTPMRINALNSIELEANEVDVGAIFCPFSMMTSNIKIGKFFQANLYSYIGHDCVIGDYVTFAPQVKCNGNVIIEDHVYVGTGAIIREGNLQRPMIIGKGSVIGMGAVVTKSVAPYQTVVGNPAKLLEKNRC